MGFTIGGFTMGMFAKCMVTNCRVNIQDSRERDTVWGHNERVQVSHKVDIDIS